MKKYQRGFGLFSILVIIVAILLAGGIYLYLQTRHAPESINTPNFEATTTSPQNSLQTYTNTQYGFSFQYPNDVSINPNPPAENTMPENYDVVVATAKGSTVSGRLSINLGPGITYCTNLSFVTDPATASEYSDYTYSNGATTTINGVPFFSFSNHYSGAENFFEYDYTYSVIRPTKNGNLCYSIQISIRPNTSDATIDPSDVPAALVEKDKILAELMPLVQSFTFSN
jgi:hypothetical protein